MTSDLFTVTSAVPPPPCGHVWHRRAVSAGWALPQYHQFSNNDRSTSMTSLRLQTRVSWCFEPSQPQALIAGLKENLKDGIQLKGPQRWVKLLLRKHKVITYIKKTQSEPSGGRKKGMPHSSHLPYPRPCPYPILTPLNKATQIQRELSFLNQS